MPVIGHLVCEAQPRSAHRGVILTRLVRSHQHKMIQKVYHLATFVAHKWLRGVGGKLFFRACVGHGLTGIARVVPCSSLQIAWRACILVYRCQVRSWAASSAEVNCCLKEREWCHMPSSMYWRPSFYSYSFQTASISWWIAYDYLCFRSYICRKSAKPKTAQVIPAISTFSSWY